MVDEVLHQVEPLVRAGQAEHRKPGRPGPDQLHQPGERGPRGQPVLHPAGVTRQRAAHDSGAGVRAVLAQDQVRGQIAGLPSGAEGRLAGAEFSKQVTDRTALVLGVSHSVLLMS